MLHIWIEFEARSESTVRRLALRARCETQAESRGERQRQKPGFSLRLERWRKMIADPCEPLNHTRYAPHIPLPSERLLA